MSSTTAPDTASVTPRPSAISLSADLNESSVLIIAGRAAAISSALAHSPMRQ